MRRAGFAVGTPSPVLRGLKTTRERLIWGERCPDQTHPGTRAYSAHCRVEVGTASLAERGRGDDGGQQAEGGADHHQAQARRPDQLATGSSTGFHQGDDGEAYEELERRPFGPPREPL